MTITLEQAQTALNAWVEASVNVAKGQSHNFNGRQLTLANASEINDQITFWERKVTALTAAASGGRKGPDVALADFGGAS